MRKDDLGNGTSGPRRRLRLLALGIVFNAFFAAVPGCLNPRPEELPSSEDGTRASLPDPLPNADAPSAAAGSEPAPPSLNINAAPADTAEPPPNPEPPRFAGPPVDAGADAAADAVDAGAD